jgi:hypothetical protein
VGCVAPRRRAHTAEEAQDGPTPKGHMSGWLTSRIRSRGISARQHHFDRTGIGGVGVGLVRRQHVLQPEMMRGEPSGVNLV